MSKALLLSVKPKWVEKILNGEKTIEVRKKFPKDYVGWVYIYCTKEEYLYKTNKGYHSSKKPLEVGKGTEYSYCYSDEGMVVARFYCDKVEEIRLVNVEDYSSDTYEYQTESLIQDELLERSSLQGYELDNYLSKKLKGYAINISQLEIFDKPKELSEFRRYCDIGKCKYKVPVCEWCNLELTKAPQNMVYIEV